MIVDLLHPFTPALLTVTLFITVRPSASGGWRCRKRKRRRMRCGLLGVAGEEEEEVRPGWMTDVEI